MEENKETIYKFDGSAFLNEVEPDKKFFIKIIKKEDKRTIYKEVTIGKVWASGGPTKYYIHAELAKVEKQPYGRVHSFEISEEEYRRFIAYKGDKRRLNLLIKAAAGFLVIKKNPATVIKGIRMTEELAAELTANAAKCNMSFSDYCRTLLQGKTPMVALNQDELSVLEKIVQFRIDVLKFAGAYFNVLRSIPNQQRPNYLVAGESFEFWRNYLRNGLKCLDRLIEKCK